MRSRTYLSLVSIACAVGTVAAPAFAEDNPTFAYTHPDAKDPPKPGVEWTATAEAGVVATTGNSENLAVTAGLHTSRKENANKFAFDGTVAYAEAGNRTFKDLNGNGVIDGPQEIVEVDTTTAETLTGKVRYDRYLSDFDSLYIAAIAARDIPAGKEYQIGGQAGYSRRLYKTPTAETVAEIGYDFTEEKPIGSPGVPIDSIRVFVGHKGVLTTGTTLEASIEALSNLNRETLATLQDCGAFADTRVNARLAISAKIGKSLAAQMSIEAHFDNRPDAIVIPNGSGGDFMDAAGFVPVADKLDTVMKFTMIYSFL